MNNKEKRHTEIIKDVLTRINQYDEDILKLFKNGDIEVEDIDLLNKDDEAILTFFLTVEKGYVIMKNRMNAKAYKTLTKLYDLIDDETIILCRPRKKDIQDYAEILYGDGYNQGYKDALKMTREMLGI